MVVLELFFFRNNLHETRHTVSLSAFSQTTHIPDDSLHPTATHPFKARREMKELGERLKSQGVEGNMVGDGLAKGGILVIAPDGEVRHVFYEDPGKGVPDFEVAAIVSAAKGVASASGVVSR